MAKEIIIPESKDHWLELRRKDITSTEVSALFGLSPYLTKFELWHRKHNDVTVEFEENERMKWGNRLEESIAHGIAEDLGWEIRKKSEYVRDSELRIGASFDYEITDVAAILEIKNVDGLVFKQGWILNEEDTLEAPTQIELQIQMQMLVTGFNKAYLGALVGGNKAYIIERDRDEEIQESIIKQSSLFWKSIDEGIAPEPDFEKDAAFISQLYSQSNPNKVMPATGEIDIVAERYRQVSEKIKELEAVKAAQKAKLLTMMGDCAKVLGERYSISSGMIGEKEISYVRKGYRDFRINFKK
jgi:putative phage-type endonuclease